MLIFSVNLPQPLSKKKFLVIGAVALGFDPLLISQSSNDVSFALDRKS